MKNKNQIITAHIGGRSGSIGFPDNKHFEHEIQKIIFEADEDCLDQIKEINPNSKTLNYFVGKDNEKIKFNLNYCPYTSSSYNLNPKFENSYHKHERNTDYVYKYVMQPQKKIDLISRSLDSLSEEGIIDPPDFLSIDTQGSEYDILLSSKKIIKENILAINCEVSFSELYSNTKLFSDIHSYLLSEDYILVSIESYDIGFYRIPNKFRGKGIPLQGEVLYLKDPTKLIKNKNKRTDLIKLSFIAISFGFTEYAYKILDEINFSITEDSSDYEKFLYTFFLKIKNFNHMPKLWNEEFSFEDSLKRFNSSMKSTSRKRNFFVRILKKLNSLFNKYRRKDLSFVYFLKKYGFFTAANEVNFRIKGKL